MRLIFAWQKKGKAYSAAVFYTIGDVSNIYAAVGEEKTNKTGLYRALGIKYAEDVFKLCAKLSIVRDELIIHARPSITEERYTELTNQHSSKTMVSVSEKCLKIPLSVILESDDLECSSAVKILDSIAADQS